MRIVLDTSVAAAWALLEADDPATEEALNIVQKGSGLVPALFWFELRNTLVVNERRERISQSLTEAFLKAFSKFSIIVDTEPNEATVLTLARQHGLTVYDASYLELALRRETPIATADRKLKRAALAAGVTVIGE